MVFRSMAPERLIFEWISTLTRRVLLFRIIYLYIRDFRAFMSFSGYRIRDCASYKRVFQFKKFFTIKSILFIRNPRKEIGKIRSPKQKSSLRVI